MCEQLIDKYEEAGQAESDACQMAKAQRAETIDEINKIRYPLHKIKTDKRNNKYPAGTIDICFVDYIMSAYDILVCAGRPYIYKDGVFVADPKGLAIKEIIKLLIYPELIKSVTVNRIYDLLTMQKVLHCEWDELNDYPTHVINFKNGMYDIKKGVMFSHDPKYKSISQIPHDLKAQLDVDNSIFYKFLQSRLDDQDVKMLIEYMGYCLLHDVQYQKFMILVGVGEAGKSVILRHLERVLGPRNVSNIPLQELSGRFASAFLVGKQCNICSDLSNSAIPDTSQIKQMTGEDTIKGEYKGGDIFFFKCWAKFIFSCNELPPVLDERSNGFFRRPLIIRFNKKGDYIDNLKEKLEQEREIEVLISFLVSAIGDALKRGHLYESNNSQEAVSRYRQDSDTVESFIKAMCKMGAGEKENQATLYANYKNFCEGEARQWLGKTAFFRALEARGCVRKASSGIRWVYGLTIQEPAEDTPFDKTIRMP